MSTVVFYEKPGCLTNAGQRRLLERLGCRLIVRDLLSEPWTEARLYAFLEAKPVSQWFNPAAPKLKSGEIDPDAQDRHSAMALLLQEPLLIRRPLLDTAFGKTAGFDACAVLERLGVCAGALVEAPRDCSRPAATSGCSQAGQTP